MTFSLRTWLSLGFIGTVGIIIVTTWFYIEDMQETIASQNERLQLSESALQSTRDTLNEVTASVSKQRALSADLSTSLSNANNYINDLERKLIRHDLEALAQQKPGLIEKRINDATAQINNDLELITSVD